MSEINGWTGIRTSWMLSVQVGDTVSSVTWHLPSTGNILEYQDWCLENVGDFAGDWIFNGGNNKFHFRHSADAIAFKIRFGLQ